MNKETNWVPQLDVRLRELHAANLSFKEIANKLNEEFDLALTRNACIGRGRRIKLELRVLPTQRKRQKITPKARPYRRKVKPVAPPIVPEPEPDVVLGRFTMLQLTSQTCRWPSGECAPYFYCGEPVHGDRPYCRKHCLASYQRPEKTWL